MCFLSSRWELKTGFAQDALCRCLAFVGLVLMPVLLPHPFAVAVQRESDNTNEIREIAGARLVSPASFQFGIPAARPEKTDWETVETVDNHGEKRIAKVHCKVGKNYVVLLPNGRLVDRMADQVVRSDKKFEADTKRNVAKDVLKTELRRFSNSNMQVKHSKHFVFLYNTSPQFQEATRTILESMFSGVKGYAKNMGIDTYDPEIPLVVIMFRTQNEYQAFMKAELGEARPGLVAFYNMVSNQVVLCEESTQSPNRPDLVRGQLLSTIAHEGAHQILHNIGVQQRLSIWPQWLSEGLAEFFAPTSFGKNNRWKGAGQVNDLRMFELETFMQSRYLQGFDGRTINQAVVASQLDSTGYAQAWSLVHFLARKRKKKLYSLVAQLSELPPMYGMVARPGKPVAGNLLHFETVFGDDDQALEVEMVEYLGNLKYQSPVADYIHYVGLAQVPAENGPRKFACFFHTEEKVEQWRQLLQDQLKDQQTGGVQWRVERTRNRSEANSVIRKFLR